jgi:hypothetical protein
VEARLLSHAACARLSPSGHLLAGVVGGGSGWLMQGGEIPREPLADRLGIPRLDHRPLPIRLAARRSLTNGHRRPLADVPGEFECIPVRESDAAVRAALAHQLRIRRAVDAIAFG